MRAIEEIIEKIYELESEGRALDIRRLEVLSVDSKLNNLLLAHRLASMASALRWVLEDSAAE